jgi:hypothetical protein
MAAEFERDHGVVSFFVKLGELSRRIPAAAGAPDAGRDLFPIRHLVQAL